jgi:hypothetical protein
VRIEVNGRSYRVRLPARAWPHLKLLSSAFTEAGAGEDELARAEERVLALCVEGEVDPDDADVLLVKILAYFAQVMGSEFRSFRPELPAHGRGGG